MAETHAKHEGLNADRQAGIAANGLIVLIKLYQRTLGPIMGGQCRFAPTCSHYAIEALQVHGACRGSWLIIKRLARCHPFGGSGDDPVPHPTHK